MLRLAMIVAGFPNLAHPGAGIFNLRAAQSLACVTDLTVVALRALKPGRRLCTRSRYEGVPVLTVSVPQVPVSWPWHFIVNALLCRWFGLLLLCPQLRGYDLIHSVDAAAVGVAASHWSRNLLTPHVVQAIGSDVNHFLPSTRNWRFIRECDRGIQAAVCNCRALSTAFIALYPTIRNISTVYRGVDLERFHPRGPAAGPLAYCRPVRFLFLGGFPQYYGFRHGCNTKGGDVLLAAWRAGERELVAAGASLLVGGPEADGEPIRRWRATLLHPERVYAAGILPTTLIPAHMRAVDVVLVPSMEEGLEAAACGRAVFGSNVGGIPEVIVHGRTGVLLPPGDVRAWQEALVSFARQPESLCRMGEQARERAEAVFDRRSYAPRMLQIYSHALNAAPEESVTRTSALP
jgi:glycosyltransferase involved in cell wall biosynthesis